MWSKDILRIGTFHPPGNGPITFTAADLDRMQANGQAMVSAGWTVPMCVEHMKKAKPTRAMSKDEARARGFLCFIDGFRVTPDGRLQAYGPDPEDAEDQKLLKKLRFVSPEIKWNWQTGDGKVWSGPAITHLALTPTPVVHNQGEFQRLSLASSEASRTVRLSMSDFKGNPMAAETEELDAELEETPEAGETTDAQEEMAEGEEAAQLNEESDAELLALFEKVGLFIPPEALESIESLKSALAISLKTKLMGDGETPGEEAPADETALPTEDGTAPAGAMPAPNPPPPGGGLGLSLANSKREEKLIEHGRSDLLRELTKLRNSGRITPHVFERERQQLAGCQLSLTADGDLEDTPLAAKIAAWKDNEPNPALIPGKKPGAVRLSRASVPERPRNSLTIPETKEDAERVNAAMDETLAVSVNQ